MKSKLMFGDCLERMKEIPDNSIDCIITDLPYGTTACKWDNIIPFEKMWIDDPHWLPLVLSGKRIKAEFVFGNNGEKIISEKVEII